MPRLCGGTGKAFGRRGGMKLLFDQNLSFKLVSAMAPVSPGSKHLSDFDLTYEQDESIWSFAAKKGFTIVSKDSDFVYLSMLRGHPPKVVYIRRTDPLTSSRGGDSPLISQRSALPSSDAEANILPSGDHAKPNTRSV